MENVILGFTIFSFILTFFGYYSLSWKIKRLKDKMKYLFSLVGSLPIILYAIKIIINYPISDESIINFLLLYFSGLIGGGIASSIIYNLENPKRKSYNPYKYKKSKRYK
jgi:CDP-diglyceride synthetase